MGRILFYAAALLALASNISAAPQDPIVTVDSLGVKYRGLARDSVEEFNSVKFAEDTSGSRRFAPPEPYVPPRDGGVIDATAPAPACPQIRDPLPPFFGETPDQSEDCLYLRITRPAKTKPDAKLPVVVHVMGGGVIKGHSQEALYDPTHLVTSSSRIGQPVVHVVLNYRVTIFGFARLPILKDQQSLNVGMRDQRAGFQWVKDHIAAFGGDRNRVTSFGLSSGGTFTSVQLMAYGGTRGVPFDRAWCMSGPPGTALNMTSDVTELHTRAVARRLGCNPSSDDSEILQCLRDVPMDRLTEAAMAYAMQNHPPAGLFTFIPSVDDDFLPDRQSALYKAGRFVKVPIVFGWTHDDGTTNTGPATDFQTEADIKTSIRSFAHALTDDDYATLFALYPASDFDAEVHNYEARKAAADPTISVHYFRAAHILRDLLFTCSSLDFASEMSKPSDPPSFSPGARLYDLNQSMVTPLLRAATGMPWLGVVHGSDIDYLYNNMFPRETLADADLALSDQLLAAFVNFAYAADPNGADDASPSWPEAFQFKDNGASSESSPAVNVQLVGGPWGTGNCHLAADTGAGEGSFAAEQMDMQHPMVDSTKYGDVGGERLQQGQRELERDRLLERCGFINALAEKLGR
ncbi:alpha/beta-hydrolase [Apiospora aurea]|uniref:Alpha/beta-hydrolase n=1 Tax=Apiospora aurea TaxID=335848 RepID=A0ABR1PYN3_9PEZI